MQNKILELPQFDTKIVIYRDTNISNIEKVLKKIQFDNNKIIDYDTEWMDWFVFEFWDTIFCFLNTDEEDVFVHEMYHIVSKIHLRTWVIMDSENDEMGAYYMWWIYKETRKMEKIDMKLFDLT